MADKDRRSNMINSSVNAQPAKGGAGAFAWGSATDVPVDYMPQGIPQGVGIQVMQAAPSSSVFVQQPQYTYTQDAFPTLGASTVSAVPAGAWGGAVTAVPVSAAPPTVYTAAPVQASSVIVGQETIRTVESGFDGTHPRHLFAVKPNKPHSAVAVVDWSQQGVPQATTQTIVQAHNPAHLSPVATIPAPVQMPISQLRAQMAPAVYAPPPQIMKPVIQQKIIQQPRR